MRASRAEIKIEEILQMNELHFKEEYEFKDLVSKNNVPLRFDFAVFDDDWNLDFLIEYQGKQHYEAVGKFGGYAGFAKQRQNDNLKRNYCKEHGINLIEIPFAEENLISYDYIMRKAGY